MTTVLKPFNTVQRRFKAGDELPADADLTPFSLADLEVGGFVSVDFTPDAPAAPVAPALAPAAPIITPAAAPAVPPIATKEG